MQLHGNPVADNKSSSVHSAGVSDPNFAVIGPLPVCGDHKPWPDNGINFCMIPKSFMQKGEECRKKPRVRSCTQGGEI